MLERVRRWLPIRDYLKSKWIIYVHFFNRHANYYTAWLYTTKEDHSFIQSRYHPDLANRGPPRTMLASQAHVKRQLSALDDSSAESTGNEDCEEGIEEGVEEDMEENPRRANKTNKRRQSQHLSCFKVLNIIVQKNIQNRTELLALAHEQKSDGKSDLAEFLMNRGNRVVEKVISTAWDMERSSEVLRRSKMSRIEILQKYVEDPCTEGCNGRWLQCAEQILLWNNVSREAFSEAVGNLLEKGRGKFQNIFLKGPANTGKTFLLNP